MSKAIILIILSIPFLIFGADGDILQPDSVLAVMLEQWEKINDCTCNMETYIILGEKEMVRYYDYRFMKPQWIRVTITSGTSEGAEVMYNPDKVKVIAHAGGIISFINVSFSPGNPRVCSLRGHRMDDNHMGFIIGRWFDYLKTCSPTCASDTGIIVFQASGIDTSKYYGAYAEKLFVNAENMFPLGFEQYDIAGTLIHSVKLTNIKIDVGLTREDFEM